MIFAKTTKIFKKLIKNIKQHFTNFQWSSVIPTNQDLSNDTTFSQIKSRVPVPLRKKWSKNLETVPLNSFSWKNPDSQN